jgi:hypothetical protein
MVERKLCVAFLRQQVDFWRSSVNAVNKVLLAAEIHAELAQLGGENVERTDKLDSVSCAERTVETGALERNLSRRVRKFSG